MNTRIHTAESLLDEVTLAAREQFTEADLDAATARFRQAMPRSPARHEVRLPRWLKVSGAFATLAVTVTLLSLLLPGKHAGNAFAQAQAWFQSYETMNMELVTRQGDQELYRMKVWNERGGATRIEIPPIVQIVDPVRGELVIAMPDGSVMRQSLPSRVPALAGREELAWLEELQAFKGIAEPLTERRSVAGIDAQGWRLELSGMQHTLWVDPSDSRPLLLEALLGADVTMESTFAFDQALPEELFRIPAAD